MFYIRIHSEESNAWTDWELINVTMDDNYQFHQTIEWMIVGTDVELLNILLLLMKMPYFLIV